MKKNLQPTIPEHAHEAQDSGALADYLGQQLRLTHMAAVASLEAELLPHQASPVRFALLVYVSEWPGCTQIKLAEILGVDRSTLVPMFNSMEKDDLLTRHPSPLDKRANGIWITPKGEALIKKLKPLVAAHNRKLSAGLSEAQLKTLTTLLKKVRQNIS
ncbi:MAG: MarR family transcriptional regulator [Steroidobacteraceae bacterium]